MAYNLLFNVLIMSAARWGSIAIVEGFYILERIDSGLQFLALFIGYGCAIAIVQYVVLGALMGQSRDPVDENILTTATVCVSFALAALAIGWTALEFQTLKGKPNDFALLYWLNCTFAIGMSLGAVFSAKR